MIEMIFYKRLCSTFHIYLTVQIKKNSKLIEYYSILLQNQSLSLFLHGICSTCGENSNNSKRNQCSYIEIFFYEKTNHVSQNASENKNEAYD